MLEETPDFWKGRTALVAGGGSGIGAETARHLAALGVRVVVGDIAGAEAVARDCGDGARAEPLDVTDEAAWERVIGAICADGGLDFLVNSAGINPGGSIVDATYADWRRTFAVNVDGMFLGCKHAMRAMTGYGTAPGARGGAIVNVSSPQGLRTEPSLVAYGASKAAALNLTRSVALHGADKGVRCNAVLPGAVATPMVDRFLDTLPDRAAGVAMVAAMHPMNRMCPAGDVAATIAFLLSPAAGFITGVSLPVDGGFLAR